MSKPRKEYAYVAHRIDPDNSQNLGDFMIGRWRKDGTPSAHYHYASDDYEGRGGERFRCGMVINRITLRLVESPSRTYTECIRAVERLLEEEGQGNEA